MQARELECLAQILNDGKHPAVAGEFLCFLVKLLVGLEKGINPPFPRCRFKTLMHFSKLLNVSRLGAFDASTITPANGRFSLKIDDLKSGEESAANIHFRDQRTLTMRIWVRLAATLLPALLLVISLWIQ